MKNKMVALVILCLLAMFILSACTSFRTIKANETTKTFNGIEKTENTLPKNIKTTSNKNVGGGSISTRKYRVNYYDVPYQFVLLVGEEAFWEWDEEYNKENPDETNVMVMKKFIEYFNVSKEDFEKANLAWTKTIANEMGGKPVMNPKDFANQETDESYNSDVIYTFDDIAINNYYLSGYYPYIYESDYEEAVSTGEYVSQTNDWIDIEALEAEIIAKYGEAEIVTEEAETNIAEETLVIPTEPIETTAKQTKSNE